MFKKLLILVAILTPFVADAADKKKKEEPVVHLTDEQIVEDITTLIG